MRDALHPGVTIWQGIRAQSNIANALTLIRVIMVIPVYWTAFFEVWDWSTYFIVIAAATDAEGIWARATNTTTPLGWAMDPVADKIFTNLVIAAGVFITGDVWLLLLWSIMFGYDVDNTIRRWPALREACLGREPKSTTPVTPVSKGKTVLLFMVMVVLYAPHEWGFSIYLVTLTQVALLLVSWSWAYNRRLTLTAAWSRLF